MPKGEKIKSVIVALRGCLMIDICTLTPALPNKGLTDVRKHAWVRVTRSIPFTNPPVTYSLDIILFCIASNATRLRYKNITQIGHAYLDQYKSVPSISGRSESTENVPDINFWDTKRSDDHHSGPVPPFNYLIFQLTQ
jgi:hypothetical protein